MIHNTAKKLKLYLDSIQFHGIYKYLTGMNHYYVTPYRVNSICEITPGYMDEIIKKGGQNWLLVKCLLLTADVPYQELSDLEKAVADDLIAAQFLRLEGDRLYNAGFQLISFNSLYLMIDASINYPRLGNHEVYIGIDTYLMLYYLDTTRITPGSTCLDLCTGSSIAGLYMSHFSQHVTVTDIAAKPLLLSRFNCALNNKESVLTVREEDFNLTLDKGELFDFVTCNPPFVAFPEDMEAPIFARGYDKDGLGHYRLLLGKIKHYLAPGGTACFVADFIGDETEPYFVAELKEYVQRQSLDIDVYIDNRLSLADQMTAYPYFLQKRNQGYTIEEVREKSHHFLAQELRAKYYYMTTLVIGSHSSAPHLRVFNRSLKPPMTQPRQESFDFHQTFPLHPDLPAVE
jgi:methylase of polypeptide subunit release factors